MIYDLPNAVDINGKEYEINSDFRCILDIFEVLSDNELVSRERAFYALGYFYPDFAEMPPEDYEEAGKKLFWFIDGGQEQTQEARKAPKVMDWEQDFPYIIGPVNKIIGHEIRNDKHLHWWTFLAAYMDIGECLFAQIVSIRQKIAAHKKLEKHEKEWYHKNRKLVDLHTSLKYTAAEMEFMKSLSGGG